MWSDCIAYFLNLSINRFAGNPTSWKAFSQTKSLARAMGFSQHLGNHSSLKSAAKPAFLMRAR